MMYVRVVIFKDLMILIVVRNVETIQLNFYIRVLQRLTVGFDADKICGGF